MLRSRSGRNPVEEWPEVAGVNALRILYKRLIRRERKLGRRQESMTESSGELSLNRNNHARLRGA